MKQPNSSSDIRRIYVKVESRFDETGTMIPTALIWSNGKVYDIEGIRDFRPARSAIGADLPGDCYTVVIKGQEKHLFFQKADPLYPSKVGRWFVESRGNRAGGH